MFATRIKVLLSFAATGFSVAFAPIALISPRRRLNHFHSILNNEETDVGGGGSFEFVGEVTTKGKLVVTFEPDVPEPTPTPPSPAPPPREVFTGMSLPPGEIPPAINDATVQAKIDAFLPVMANAVLPMFGQPKLLGLERVQDAWIKTTLNGTVANHPDYKYFGTDNKAKALTYLVKTDPFFASALTKTCIGFELRSFDIKDPDAKDENASLFRKLVSNLDGAGHRVNFYFNSDMEITSYRVYDDVTGSRIFQFGGEKDEKLDYWASSAIYNTFFYAEAVHATIHVFHYLLTSAFQYVSEDYEEMHQWAKFYANNIQSKYDQVADLLIRDAPVPGPLDFTGENLKRYNAVITGVNGFGAEPNPTKEILLDMMNRWGQSSTASGWLDFMMNISRKDMEKAGILTEFYKQVDLVAPFAKDAANAFRDINADKTTIAELRLKDYLKRCGSFTSTIDSLDSWIQLMSVTGDVHGATLGFTRLVAMPDVMRWRNIKDSKWEAPDTDMILKITATAIGLEDGRHTMTATIDAPYNQKLQDVLDNYDKETTRMKEEYEIQIQKDPDFNDYGWILSGFCTDDFDGKQLTSATYF
jgi:hypothetical protein